MRSRIVVLVNDQSGAFSSARGRALVAEQLASVVPDASIRWSDAQTTMDQLIRQAMEEAPSVLVAGGGDGTINAVAAAIVGTAIVLGVLPLGTLNHFAKDVGIPPELPAAVALLRTGVVTRADVGVINERIFLNKAGLGPYPEIVRLREREQRHGIAKWPAALVATLLVLYRCRQLGLRLHLAGTTLRRRTSALFVGNNTYSNDDSMEPHRTTLSAGTLSVVIPRARRPLALLAHTLRALVGSVRESRGFETLNVKQFTIESTQQALHVSIDGEVTSLTTPLHCCVRPGALHVLVPADAAQPCWDGHSADGG